MDGALDPFVRRWGLVPADVLSPLRGNDGPAALVTLLTSTFLHAGWLHLLSNMVYLACFGPPVERRLGAGPVRAAVRRQRPGRQPGVSAGAAARQRRRPSARAARSPG